MGLVAKRSKIRFTYHDYKSLPESETKRYELLDGELVMVPAPSSYHQSISKRIEFVLYQRLEKEGLGEVLDAPIDVVLGEGDDREVVQPDIIFISKERSQIIKEEEIEGAPDLVIEILSPATEKRDRAYKKSLYARYGVKEYWIVDPRNKVIELYKLGEEGFELQKEYKMGEILKSLLFQGLEIDLREVF